MLSLGVDFEKATASSRFNWEALRRNAASSANCSSLSSKNSSSSSNSASFMEQRLQKLRGQRKGGLNLPSGLAKRLDNSRLLKAEVRQQPRALQRLDVAAGAPPPPPPPPPPPQVGVSSESSSSFSSGSSHQTSASSASSSGSSQAKHWRAVQAAHPGLRLKKNNRPALNNSKAMKEVVAQNPFIPRRRQGGLGSPNPRVRKPKKRD